MTGIWDWIKRHGLLVIGALGGLAAIYLLFVAPSSAQAAGPQQGTPSISFPPTTTGGGGGGGGPTGGPTAAPNPNLPYSPDFTLLNAIPDAVLKGLYSQLYNLQVQFNNAYAQGNQALMNSLSLAIQGLQAQIQGYVPTTTPSGPGQPQPPVPGPTPPTLPPAWAVFSRPALTNSLRTLVDALNAQPGIGQRRALQLFDRTFAGYQNLNPAQQAYIARIRQLFQGQFTGPFITPGANLVSGWSAWEQQALGLFNKSLASPFAPIPTVNRNLTNLQPTAYNRPAP